MTKDVLELDREKALLLILAMRVLPLAWFTTLGKGKEDYERVRTIIYGLKRENFLEIVPEVTGERFVVLTQKGYERANGETKLYSPLKEGLVKYRYSNWSKAKGRIESIKEIHHFFTFRFLYEYFRNGRKANNIFTDYDKDCRLEYREISGKFRVQPDALIFPYSESNFEEIIAVEADTGTEIQPKLLEKVLKYAMATKHYQQIERLEKLKLYFMFKTQHRIESVFGEKDGKLPSLFREVNWLKYAREKTSIMIKDVLDILSEDRLSLYSGTYDNHIEEYQNIDLYRLIKTRNPQWASL